MLSAQTHIGSGRNRVSDLSTATQPITDEATPFFSQLCVSTDISNVRKMYGDTLLKEALEFCKTFSPLKDKVVEETQRLIRMNGVRKK